MDELATQAVQAWLAEMQHGAPRQPEDKGRGYLWKSLFLPEGSQLRISVGQQDDPAAVVGDRIVYQGQALSPRQLVLTLCGPGRNAWRELLIRFPGDKQWQRASILRRKQQASENHIPPPPTQVMMEAASAMSEVLRVALAVLDKTSAQAETQRERRIPHSRRAEDLLQDE